MASLLCTANMAHISAIKLKIYQRLKCRKYIFKSLIPEAYNQDLDILEQIELEI